MGDFYEMFFEDAIEAAAALDITLTKRGQPSRRRHSRCAACRSTPPTATSRGSSVSGFKVAICEQMEDPAEAKKRGAQGGRQAGRGAALVITPGTITEDSSFSTRAAQQLSGGARPRPAAQCALAWLRHVDRRLPGRACDASRRDPGLGARAPCSGRAAAAGTSAPAPRRCSRCLADWKAALSTVAVERASIQRQCRAPPEGRSTRSPALDGFGSFSPGRAGGGSAPLVDYVELTQKRPACRRLSVLRKVSSGRSSMPDARHRRRDPAQPRAYAQALTGESPGQFAGHHRPNR